MADLDEILEIEMPEVDETAQLLQGQTFVITGSLQFYPNRNACKEEIERLGGQGGRKCQFQDDISCEQ